MSRPYGAQWKQGVQEEEWEEAIPLIQGCPAWGRTVQRVAQNPGQLSQREATGGRTQTVDASPSGMGRGCGVGGPKGGHVEGIRGLERVP